MCIRKKIGVLILASFILIPLISQLTFAALISQSTLSSLNNLWELNQKYGWIEFIAYFLIFGFITRLALEKSFGEESPAIRPLYIIVGLVLSVALTGWSKSKGFSLFDLGPLAIGLLIITAIGLIYKTLKSKGEEKKGFGSIAAIIAILIIILLAILFLYPNIFGNFVPNADFKDILWVIVALLVIFGIWKLIDWLGGLNWKRSSEHKEGRKFKIPKWSKWLLLGFIILLILYFFGIPLLGMIPLWVWLALLLLIPIITDGVLTWKENKGRKPIESEPTREKPAKKIKISPEPAPKVIKPIEPKYEKLKVTIIKIPDIGSKAYIQGIGDQKIRLTAKTQGGSGNFSYRWRIADYSLTDDSNIDCKIDISKFILSSNTEAKKIMLWVGDTKTGETKKEESIITIAKGVYTSTLRINLPWPSPGSNTVQRGNEIQLQAELSDPSAADQVIWKIESGIMSAGKNLETDFKAAKTTLGTVTNLKVSKHLYSIKKNSTELIKHIINEIPGDYTILCSAFKSGVQVPEAVDIIYIKIEDKTTTPTTEEVEIKITEPQARTDGLLEVEEDTEKEFEVVASKGDTKIDKYRWFLSTEYEEKKILDISQSINIKKLLFEGRKNKCKLDVTGDFTIICVALDKTDKHLARDYIAIKVNSKSAVTPPEPPDRIEIINKPSGDTYIMKLASITNLPLECKIIKGSNPSYEIKKIYWAIEEGNIKIINYSGSFFGSGEKIKYTWNLNEIIKKEGVWTIFAMGYDDTMLLIDYDLVYLNIEK